MRNRNIHTIATLIKFHECRVEYDRFVSQYGNDTGSLLGKIGERQLLAMQK